MGPTIYKKSRLYVVVSTKLWLVPSHHKENIKQVAVLREIFKEKAKNNILKKKVRSGTRHAEYHKSQQ